MIFYLIIIIFSLTIFLPLLRDHYEHFRFNQWMDFSDQMFIWYEEIPYENQDVKKDFLNYMGKFANLGLDEKKKLWRHIPQVKAHIYQTYSQHIPSIKKDIRRKKLKSLINK